MFRHPHVSRLFVLVRVIVLAALLPAACAPRNVPANIVVAQVATATGLATSTQPRDAELSITLTPSATTRAPTPTLSGLRTKTPVPSGSITLTPTATRRGGAAPPTETPTGPAVNGGSLDTRADGVIGTLAMEKADRVYQTNEQMWLRWTVSNITANSLSYGHIGVVPSTGEFHTSWSGSTLRPHSNSNWRDWVSFSAPGEYTLVLAICLSPAAECEGGGRWVDLTAPLSVTVR
jgi:hypothetical protein